MKYNKILCWLREGDEQRLRDANTKGMDIVFTHSVEEFSSLFSPNSYLVVSLQFAENDNTQLKNLIQKFPEFDFHLFAIYDGDFTLEENAIFESGFNNISNRVYLVEEVLDSQ